MPAKADKLKAKILKAVQEGDIASLYIMQDEVMENLDEEAVNDFFANILDLALENLTNTLEQCVKLDLNDPQDFATLRALYEYAMEHYHELDLKDASALFEVLSGITDDLTLSQALIYHYKAAEIGINLDDFMDHYADMEKTEQNGTFYISSFKEKAQKLLNNKKKDTE